MLIGLIYYFHMGGKTTCGAVKWGGERAPKPIGKHMFRSAVRRVPGFVVFCDWNVEGSTMFHEKEIAKRHIQRFIGRRRFSLTVAKM